MRVPFVWAKDVLNDGQEPLEQLKEIYDELKEKEMDYIKQAIVDEPMIEWMDDDEKKEAIQLFQAKKKQAELFFDPYRNALDEIRYRMTKTADSYRVYIHCLKESLGK